MDGVIDAVKASTNARTGRAYFPATIMPTRPAR